MPSSFAPLKRWSRRFICALLACAALVSLLSWAAVDGERMLQSMTRRFGETGVPVFREWRELLRVTAPLAEPEKLKRVNEFFNRRMRFEDDIVVWKVADYWATPVEFIGRGAGDCEDFVIAKYFSLIELGVERGKLRLTYVRASIGGAGSGITQAHMVLGYYATPSAEPLVLDNLITDIRPASRRPDLAPVFSFNGDGVWMAGADKPATPIDRLARWTDLILKMKAEGYEP
jgi:predicted transglutaminase-like cysteine proteinase